MGIATDRWIRYSLCVVPIIASATGCARGRVAAVSPEEIPSLEQRLAREPRNPQLVLRYAAALFAAERCDSARVVALRAIGLQPADAVGPLVLGQCLERAAEYDQAIAVYREYLQGYPDRRGSDAVRAREMLALRARANAQARAALAREAELAQQPADPQTIAVLPLQVVGDTTFEPLSRGLAQMIISDLDLLRRFRLVERLQLGALLEELELGQTGRVDPATAARVGQLLQAGRMVQGLAVIPREGDTRLEASVVLPSGEVLPAEAAAGRMRELLRLEKDLVVAIAQRLGYVLSEAERQLILENGTQNLAAFLAYSRGLVAEDLGDYQAAAQHFSQAVQTDPGFQQARQQYRAVAVATQVEAAQAADVTTVAAETAEEPAAAAEPAGEAVTTVVQDVASTQGEQATATTQTEQTTSQSTNTQTSNPQTTTTQTNPTQTATGVIRIVFILPFILP